MRRERLAHSEVDCRDLPTRVSAPSLACLGRLRPSATGGGEGRDERTFRASGAWSATCQAETRPASALPLFPQRGQDALRLLAAAPLTRARKSVRREIEAGDCARAVGLLLLLVISYCCLKCRSDDEAGQPAGRIQQLTRRRNSSLRIGKPFMRYDGELAAFPADGESIMDLSAPVLVVDDFAHHDDDHLESRAGRSATPTSTRSMTALPRWRSFARKKYGLVLSDWDMRPMNGTEFIQASAPGPDEFRHARHHDHGQGRCRRFMAVGRRRISQASRSRRTI